MISVLRIFSTKMASNYEEHFEPSVVIDFLIIVLVYPAVKPALFLFYDNAVLYYYYHYYYYNYYY